MPHNLLVLAEEVIDRHLFCCSAICRLMALNVTCRNAAICLELRDKPTLRGHHKSVVRDPKAGLAVGVSLHCIKWLDADTRSPHRRELAGLRHGEAERPGGLEVDNGTKARRALDW